MGALAQWLGTDQWIELTNHLGRQPYALPGVAAGATRDFRWAMLNEALASTAADVLVVRRGQSVPRAAPRSLADVQALFGAGIGIALRRADHASDRVKALAQSVSQDVP